MNPSPSPSSAVAPALASIGFPKNALRARVLVNIDQYSATNSQRNFNELRIETTAKYWPILVTTPHSAVRDCAVGDRAVGDGTVGDRAVGDRTVGDRTVGDRAVGDRVRKLKDSRRWDALGRVALAAVLVAGCSSSHSGSQDANLGGAQDVAGSAGQAAGAAGGGGIAVAGQGPLPSDGGSAGAAAGGMSAAGGGSVAGTAGTPIVPVAPTPQAKWENVTGNLAGMASECGNLGRVSSHPTIDMLLVGVAKKGLFSSTDGGVSWQPLGTTGASITNRISYVAYDPAAPMTFWESGIYNGGGVYKTTDNGASFVQVGSVTHSDSVSVNFSDPARMLLLAGSHEQAQKLFRSLDGGAN